MRVTLTLLVAFALHYPVLSFAGGRTNVVLDEEMRLVLSDANVVRNLHVLTARHGMHLVSISRDQETEQSAAVRVTYMGGAVPQNSGTFTLRVAPEGPPPVHLSVTFVSPVELDLVQEGPPTP